MTESTAGGDWIRPFHATAERRTRLVCFPHAGGSASFFHPLSAALPEVEVLGVQYPGRQDRRSEPCLSDLGELADRISAVLPRWLDRPTMFFGHSMGAVLAFEVALRLSDRGTDGPRRLFASGRRAPSRLRNERVHELDDAGIVREMERLNGTDTRIFQDPEVLRMVLPAIRADYAAIEGYRCRAGVAVGIPIDVLVGDADPRTSLDEARAWQQHTTAGCELHVFSGGHFFLADHLPRVVGLLAGHARDQVGLP